MTNINNIFEISIDNEITEPTSSESVSFDLEKIKKKIPSHSSKKLCEIIVSARYLGLNEELDILCMEELSKRRSFGDNFEFEDFIEKSSNELPPLKFTSDGFDIRQIIQQAIGKK